MPLIAELKRRNVFRVGVAYAIVAWLLVEVASVVLPTFAAPEWVMKVFTFLVMLGFPLALILAWAFELTPEGLKREETRAQPTPLPTEQILRDWSEIHCQVAHRLADRVREVLLIRAIQSKLLGFTSIHHDGVCARQPVRR